ncbi:haloacid dehalogenase type II [Microbacterium aerolatum]|uniref:haloacid dehalogenase type II n=1 Tax=Microbacterium aerolatum TaxID=153731 RepID=UPI00384CF527
MSLHLTDVDVVVFDVLGTLVDEPAGLRSSLSAAVPTAGDATLHALTERWQRYIAEQQTEIADGRRTYVDSDVLDAEAAELALRRATEAGIPTDHTAARRLASASQRLPTWPDSVVELQRISDRVPVLALSNASSTTLFHLAATTGLRWHAAVTSDASRAYKPDPALYRRAVEVADRPAERVLMVAAHAWDLRAAQMAGMRTCYVERPVGDPPAPADHFDAKVTGLAGLFSV